MKHLLGGLFETQEQANLAYEDLRSAGFPEEDIHMLVHRPGRNPSRPTDVSIQEIARNAVLGGLIGGTIGGVVGFLIGAGVVPLPYLEPDAVPRDSLFVVMSVVWGLITGGLTGAILAVASRLLRSREKAEMMTRQIEKRGVLVTVDVDDLQEETQARRVMEGQGVLEVGNPQEKWDLGAWMSPNERPA